MATRVSSIFIRFPVSALLFLCLFYSWEKGCALEGRQTAESIELHHSHTVQVSSFLPSTVCNPSTKVLDKKTSLKVVHKHGPCSQLNQDKANVPTHTQILLQDQSRVNSIHSRLSKNSGHSGSDIKQTDATTLPAKSVSTTGAGDYLVTVGLGTPKEEVSLIFDTGSDLTWTQCQPCVRYCYQQDEPTFDPRASKSYTNITCNSAQCNSLNSATGNTLACASSTCVYGIGYGDSSFSIGFFAKERLTLTSTDVFDNFLFGCGQNNRGNFGSSAGLLGLGRDKLSLISQTAQKYNKFFSYCFPTSPSSTGHLTFGKGERLSKSVKFTPLSKLSQNSSFYGLDITGLSVGGRKLSISSSVFSTAGAIIDSGTVITRLPPAAYSALRSAFRKLMSKYPTAPALSILDTCYDFSNYKSITIPKISIFFNGGVEVAIDATGIMFANSVSQVCLAFVGNSDESNAAIYGNLQQKTYEVVYDGTGGGRVGFGPNGCS